MPDVATLGLEVQSADVVKATADLNRLSVAAAQAEANAAKLSRQKIDAQGSYAATKAAQNLAKANEIAAKAAGNLSREEMDAMRASRQTANAHAAAARAALERAKAEDTLAAAQARSAASALKEAQAQRGNPANPVNDNVAGAGGAKRHNTANILAQFQDIGVTAAMGMNPMMIAVQQGTQLSSVLMTMEKPLAGLVAGFAALFGTVSLITIALIALAVVGLQMVKWASLGETVVMALANSLSTIAPYAVGAAAALALIYAPTIIGGMVSLIAWIARIGVTALATGAEVAAGWLLAMGPVGWIILGLVAVVAAFIAFRDDIKQILGIDLVEVAKVAGNVLIAVFVGSANGIKASFGLLPAALGDLMIQAANTVIKAVESMVNGVSSLINDFIFKINATISGLPDWAGGTLKLGEVGKVELPTINNPFAGQAGAVGANIGAAINEATKTDWMGKIGKNIGDGADYATGKLKELSKWIGTLDDPKAKKHKGAKGPKTDEEKYSDIVDGANRRIASLQAEYDAIGLTETASAKLRYETELLNQAQQKGITLTSAQKTELGDLAQKMADLEVKTKNAKEAFDFAKDATKGFMSDLKNGLVNGEGFWKSFGNAALNVLDKITDKLLNDVLDALFQTGSAAGGLFGGGKGGSGGGLLGGLLSLFSAKGNAFGAGGNLTKFAKGGAFSNSVVTSPTLFKFAKGTGMMGEAGAEAIMPLSRDSSGKLGVSMHGGGHAQSGGGSASSVHVTAEVFMNEDGQWEARVRDIAQSTTASGIQVFSANVLPDRIDQHNKNPRRRG